jgi:hypothetical protein
MRATSTLTEADILEQIINALDGDFSPEAARTLLELKFDRKATQKIRSLLAKNNRGIISTNERSVLDKYLRVGQLIDLLQAKARLSLQASTDSR